LGKELGGSNTMQSHTPWAELAEVSKTEEYNREVVSTGVENVISPKLSLVADAPHSQPNGKDKSLE
ncbi:hypothetical protein Ancab_006469, partial [Ancistrocladus abbreviatus]